MAYRKVNLFICMFIAIIILLSGIVLGGCSSVDDLNFKKTGSPKTFTEVGETISYEISIVSGTNPGLDEITITDDLTGHTCKFTAYNLSHNSVTYCRVTYVITEEDIEAGEVTNTATVNGYKDAKCGSQGKWFEDSATFTITLEEITSLELAKTGTPNWFTGAGEEITYTYTVENTGNVDLAGPVTVTDDLVEVDCPKGDLKWGESLFCSASYTTTEADVAARRVKNTATASAGDVVSNEASFVVYMEVSPELTLSKKATPKVFSKEGQLITYTFELENTGNVTIDPPFEIDDPRLEDWNCPHESLEPGETVTCTGIYYTRHGDVGSTIKNCATMFAVYQGGQMTSNEACTEVGYEEPEEKPSACDIDPNSHDCFCEKYPQDC